MPKAAVATEVGKPLEIMDLDLADAQAGEVRIQLGASGVCHSDLSVTNGTLPLALPAVLGHEGAGTVVQVIGAPELTALYAKAITACGGFAERHDGEAAARGLALIAEHAQWT